MSEPLLKALFVGFGVTAADAYLWPSSVSVVLFFVASVLLLMEFEKESRRRFSEAEKSRRQFVRDLLEVKEIALKRGRNES